ncbi:MAG TPA: VCBS repeat-containing protein [bacterium]|nr:VCBS repeat-containing protein [bacterium]
MADSEQSEAYGSKRKGSRHIIAWSIGVVVGLPTLSLAILLAVSALWKSDPAAHVPAGFQAYISVPSAGSFVREVLDLKALDAILAGPKSGATRGLVRSIRSAPVIRTRGFATLADVRVDAALYDGGAFVAVARLGYRSAALRLAPLALRIAPNLLDTVKGLSYERGALPPRYVYRLGDSADGSASGATLYATRYRDLLIIASSEALLAKAADQDADGIDASLAEALGKPGTGSIRFLANPTAMTQSIASSGGALGALLGNIDFPSLSVVDLALSNDRVALSVDVPAASRDQSVNTVLGRQSRTPALLSRLPESTVYYSLISAGKPGDLWRAAAPALGPEAASAYESADKASRLALGAGIQTLLFSWMGEEMGVFGSALGPDPVFFVSIADERSRKDVFDKAFGSMVIDRDVSAVVGDTRVPRIAFPPFMRTFIGALGIRLVQPYYIVDDGFLYVCANAETLVACVKESRSGSLLVKTDVWKKSAFGVSPESSASLYYSVDRSVPFFMRGNSGLAAALRLYGRGVAAIGLSRGHMRLELSAVAASTSGLALLPGYPIAAGGRMRGEPIVGRSKNGAPLAWWTSGSNIIELDLASGNRIETAMDGPGWVALDTTGDMVSAVWAASDRGTVYRMDTSLKPLEGFPLVTGQSVSGPPTRMRKGLVVPVSSGPSLLLVGLDGSTRFSSTLGARLRSAVAVNGAAGQDMMAALPRSFESELYLFDNQGTLLPGWPVSLTGIASAAPALVEPAGASASGPAHALVVAVTESGQLSAYTTEGTLAEGFPVPLQGTFDATPVWAPGWRSIFALSAEGMLWKIGLDGSTVDKVAVRQGQSRGLSVVAFDSNRDGREELYLSGGGDALYACDGDMAPLPGFPVSGSGAPSFIDIDGDGTLDLVVRGADDTLRAYAGR